MTASFASALAARKDSNRRKYGIHYTDDAKPEATLEAAELVARSEPWGASVELPEGSSYIHVEDLSLKAIALDEGLRYAYGRGDAKPGFGCMAISHLEATQLVVGEMPERIAIHATVADVYADRKKAEFAAEWKAWGEERSEAIKGTGIDAAKDFECWTFEKEHPGSPLPGFMADWRDYHLRFENGSHAQPDTHTDAQNKRDTDDRIRRRLASYQPTRTDAEKATENRKV